MIDGRLGPQVPLAKFIVSRCAQSPRHRLDRGRAAGFRHRLGPDSRSRWDPALREASHAVKRCWHLGETVPRVGFAPTLQRMELGFEPSASTVPATGAVSAQLLAESAGRLEARSYGLRTPGTQPPTPTAFCRDHLTRVIRDREWYSPRGPPVDYRRKTGDRHCPPCVRRNAFRAVDGTRTRDHLLGKQEPYQLGHYRMVACRESSRSLDSDLQSEIEELPAIALRAIACSHEPAATCVICPQSM